MAKRFSICGVNETKWESPLSPLKSAILGISSLGVIVARDGDLPPLKAENPIVSTYIVAGNSTAAVFTSEGTLF